MFDASINFSQYNSFMKIKVNNFLSTTFFIFTLIFSYYLGVAYYDITTGLDFNKYINNVYFFNKESSVVFDSKEQYIFGQ